MIKPMMRRGPGASGFAGRAARVTGMVMARFSVAVSLDVVLADVQAGKLSEAAASSPGSRAFTWSGG